jgi:hypothetical protein
MRFALTHQHWTADNFANVLFTDEAPFSPQHSGGRVWVRLRQGERNIPEAQTIPRIRRPGPHILVWGAIRRSGVGPIFRINGNLNSNGYLRLVQDALEQIQRGRGFIWMHDNAPAHRARIIQQYFQSHSIRTLSWPPNSPELNPIENVWGIITQRLLSANLTTTDQLWNRVQQIWASEITPQLCQHLIDSMPTRIQQVLQSNGGPINY